MLNVTQRGLNLADRNDEEGPASAGFDDDGDEFGADRAEGAVPRHAGHSDVVDAVLGFPRLGEDVAELALPDHTSPERHSWGGKKKKHTRSESGGKYIWTQSREKTALSIVTLNGYT